MIYRLIVPGTFEDVQEVRVLEWHGGLGHRFAPGDLIVELETHKALIEVRAGQAGILRRRCCDEGAWCPRKGLLGLLSDHDQEVIAEQPDGAQVLEARFTLA